MVFSSVTFLFYFLPAFLLAYFLTPFKNTVLLVFSLFFYAWGELAYCLLMLFSIIFNHLFGILIDRFSDSKNKQLSLLFLAIAANLSLLFYFKYFNFFRSEVFGNQPHDIHLPIGISFFTFQSISYLVDVYRKDAKVEKNLLNLGLYISMFPQLIAGPIVRFKTVAKQIHSRCSDLSQISQGINFFIIGLGQKVIIANTVAEPADQIFSLNESQLTTALAWLGSLFYSLQIYFDFAGYSNMAIGLGLIMGFTFPENFRYPYIAQSITGFWRRWHKSLSQWFRDYLYIPLGGNRKGSGRTYFNLFIVFLLCGLWHGAAWTFIIWGCYHGLFLVLERIFLADSLQKLARPFRHCYLIFIVMIGWVIFRADNLQHLGYFMQALFGFSSASYSNPFYLEPFLSHSIVFISLLGIILSTPIRPLLAQLFVNNNSLIVRSIWVATAQVVYCTILLYCMLKIAGGSYNPFIYFRF